MICIQYSFPFLCQYWFIALILWFVIGKKTMVVFFAVLFWHEVNHDLLFCYWLENNLFFLTTQSRKEATRGYLKWLCECECFLKNPEQKRSVFWQIMATEWVVGSEKYGGNSESQWCQPFFCSQDDDYVWMLLSQPLIL